MKMLRPDVPDCVCQQVAPRSSFQARLPARRERHVIRADEPEPWPSFVRRGQISACCLRRFTLRSNVTRIRCLTATLVEDLDPVVGRHREPLTSELTLDSSVTAAAERRGNTCPMRDSRLSGAERGGGALRARIGGVSYRSWPVTTTVVWRHFRRPARRTGNSRTRSGRCRPWPSPPVRRSHACAWS